LSKQKIKIKTPRKSKRISADNHIEVAENNNLNTADISINNRLNEKLNTPQSLNETEKLKKLSHDLSERVKELNCLYDISRIVEKHGNTLEDIFRGTVNLIPPGWHYPEITCARLIIEGQIYCTDNFTQSEWVQRSDIFKHGKKIGKVEVYYTEDMPEIDEGPFLREEKKLIDAIAERIGRIIELRKAEEELQILLDSVPAMIFYKDMENRFIRVNKALADATGLPKTEIEGRSVFELYPENAEKYWKDDLEVIKSGVSKVNIIEHYIINEETRWVKTDKIPYRDSNGSIIGIIGFSEDITERKRAEEELKEADYIINRSSSVAFTWKNMEGWPVEFVTKNVERLFGFTTEEFISGSISYSECIHPDDLQRVSNEVEKFSKEDGRTEFVHKPYRIIAKDGSVQVISDWTFIVRNNQGHITHYKGIVENINRKLSAKRQALKDSNIALKEVLNRIEAEKIDIMLQVRSNIQRIIMPLVRKIEDRFTNDDANYISLLKDNLNEITSPFVGKLESKFARLSPREIEICKFVKDGMSTKEIASHLNLSQETIRNQRKSVRKKLGISNNKINLTTFLNNI